MIKILDYKTTAPEDIFPARNQTPDDVNAVVAQIIERVKKEGDAALLAYAKQFDKADLTSLEVTPAEIDEAVASMDTYFMETLELAKENIAAFHKNQLHQGFKIDNGDGRILGQKYTPLSRVGIYVPGGTASYPSTVLMDAIPAVIAGVKEIIMTTPAGADGKIAAPILAAAKVAGVTRIFKTGGAQAVAALAYGTESIPPVVKIVGPGNIYVATAKRMVFGMVDIDMIAGPSEILILSNSKSNPRYVAADMLSQAEHDRLASAVLICDDADFAKQVQAELERQIPLLPRAEICRTSIDTNGKIIVAENMQQAVQISNRLAPEHLEVCVDEPFALLDDILNAGSIFLGRNTPEALGDYLAGPNHTLPTGGTAHFSSPLSVDDFVKKSSYIYYTKEALGQVQPRVSDFAMREGLQAHAQSAAIRFEKE